MEAERTSIRPDPTRPSLVGLARCSGARMSRGASVVLMGGLASVVAAVAACEVNLSLGTECGSSPCALVEGHGAAQGPKDDSGADSEGGGAGDDGGIDAAVDVGPDGSMIDMPDARMPDEDGQVPVPGVLPAFKNLSFERTDGDGAGDLNLAATMDPWYHCLPPVNLGFLRAEQAVDSVRPTEGEYFLGYGYTYVVDLPSPIYQELSAPLKAGTRYAFMVDVQSKAGDDDIGLTVRGGNVACVAQAMLHTTPYIPAGIWVSQCVAFTPAEDLSHIAFVPNNRKGFTATNRFFVDNIRADPSCQ